MFGRFLLKVGLRDLREICKLVERRRCRRIRRGRIFRFYDARWVLCICVCCFLMIVIGVIIVLLLSVGVCVRILVLVWWLCERLEVCASTIGSAV